MAANGGLTHGAPVDGLGLVFVLGSVPHERQPFYSCQEHSQRQTDRGERATEQAGGRWRKENKRKRRAEQRDVVNVFRKRARGEMQRELSPWTLNWTIDKRCYKHKHSNI